MKAKELAELLLKDPDFDVETVTCIPDDNFYKVDYTFYSVVGISDISYSEKKIQLHIIER